MAKNHTPLPFLEAKETAMESLEAIRLSLLLCVDQGMVDVDDSLYNECLALIDDGVIVDDWDEMEELVAKAKVLEQEVAAWLSLHGRTSISLQWPRRSVSG
jgi:hypothetical protein